MTTVIAKFAVNNPKDADMLKFGLKYTSSVDISFRGNKGILTAEWVCETNDTDFAIADCQDCIDMDTVDFYGIDVLGITTK